MVFYSYAQPPQNRDGHYKERGLMRGKLTLLAGVCASAIAFPAFAQSSDSNTANDAETIIVTAQRANQRLQDVPIAVSAFST